MTTHSPAKRRSRDPERTREQILACARDEFVAHGFSGARIAEIAKQAEVTKGLIYHYFESKDQLFDAVMEAAFAPYFEGMFEMLEQAESPDLALLETAIRRYFVFLEHSPHVPRLLAWWMADQSWEETPLARKMAKAEAVELLGAQRIREGQEAGLIRADLDPSLVIKSFIDLSMMWHMSKGRHMLHCANDAAHVILDSTYLEHMVEVLMRGIASDPARD